LRNHQNIIALWTVGIVVVIICILGLGYVNYRYCQKNPGGNDFLVHWVGTQVFMKEGTSPYSDATALRIQTLAYGRPAATGEHELRVAYPFYSIIVFIPFALIQDFTIARAVWMTVLEISLVLLAFANQRLFQWKTNLVLLTLFLLFSLLWYHAVRPVINGNAVILVALGITACLWALKSGYDELAGIVLAFTTIKPQVVLLITIFIFLWCVYHKRWRFVAWFFGAMLFLFAIAFLFLPDWIVQNLREVIRYPGYNPPGTPGAVFAVWLPAMGKRLGWILTGLLAIILLVEWWQSFKMSGEFQEALWTACLTLVISQWIGIQTDPGNFIILFPALVLVFSTWDLRFKRFGKFLMIGSILILLFGIWAIFLRTVEYGSQPQQSPIMFFPLPGFLFLALYWVRWWVVRRPRAWFDELYARENQKI
jgi:hypothetical protein